MDIKVKHRISFFFIMFFRIFLNLFRWFVEVWILDRFWFTDIDSFYFFKEMARYLNLVICRLLIIEPFLFYFKKVFDLRTITHWFIILTIIPIQPSILRYRHRIFPWNQFTRRFWFSLKNTLIWQKRVVTNLKWAFHTKLFLHCFSFRKRRVWIVTIAMTSLTPSETYFFI